MSLFNTYMSRFGIILILVLLGIGICVLHKEQQDRKLDYYVVSCGPEGTDDEVQYIASQKKGQQYLVQGEYREFPNCRVVQHRGKTNKIEQIEN
jgi:hypothetical protein